MGKLIEYMGNRPVKIVEFTNEGITRSEILDLIDTGCKLSDLETLANQKIKEEKHISEKLTERLTAEEVAIALSQIHGYKLK